MMNIASSVSYSSQQDFGEYAAAVTTLPEDYDFESEKIKPNEKIIGKSSTSIAPTTTEAVDHHQNDYSTNVTQQSEQLEQLPPAQGLEAPRPSTTSANHHDKFSKLLFSSPSATVTSNGPSGPFKAIICHDCENKEGRNAGHSVSFSAIKSWNVGGKTKVSTLQIEPDSNRTTSITVKQDSIQHQHQQQQQPIDELPTLPSLVEESDKYSVDESQDEIEANDNVEILKVTTTPSAAAPTKKPNLPTKSWNFSSSWHLGSSSSSAGNGNTNNNKPPRKPIFTDLLKYPYDVLNAPQAEPTTTTTSSTTTELLLPQEPPINQQQQQIHINHQQKFNDSITSNYQHFQQFIQKNLNQPPQQQAHYQSTAMPEQNYEVDESLSLKTNGRVHGVQSTTTTRIPVVVNSDNNNADGLAKVSHHHHQQRYHSGSDHDDGGDHEQDAKFGYVVEGRNFRKYRVEEKTSDGFIVG